MKVEDHGRIAQLVAMAVATALLLTVSRELATWQYIWTGQFRYLLLRKLLSLGLILSIPGLLAALLLLPIRKARGASAAAVSLSFVISAVFCLYHVGGRARHLAFSRIVVQGELLVDAIDEYVESTGCPPVDEDHVREILGPDFLQTGAACHPEFYYGCSADGEHWRLRMSEMVGMFESHDLSYRSDQNYDLGPYAYIAVVRRYGDWAHLNDNSD